MVTEARTPNTAPPCVDKVFQSNPDEATDRSFAVIMLAGNTIDHRPLRVERHASGSHRHIRLMTEGKDIGFGEEAFGVWRTRDTRNAPELCIYHGPRVDTVLHPGDKVFILGKPPVV